MRFNQPHVHSNHRGRRTPNHVISNAKPNVGTYGWIPNQNPVHRTQPHEWGTFFASMQRTGQGAVGVSPFDSILHTQPVSANSLNGSSNFSMPGSVTTGTANAAFINNSRRIHVPTPAPHFRR